MVYLEQSSGDQQQCSFRRSRMGNGACANLMCSGKIIIKGASGLQFGGDAVGGLIIIEPVSVKRHLFGKTILNLASNGERRFHELKSTQGNERMELECTGNSHIWETKHPIMSCLTQNRS
jgi:hypothetical protein